jgi:hypothetical protein
VTTWLFISEARIFHNHCYENLKFYGCHSVLKDCAPWRLVWKWKCGTAIFAGDGQYRPATLPEGKREAVNEIV